MSSEAAPIRLAEASRQPALNRVLNLEVGQLKVPKWARSRFTRAFGASQIFCYSSWMSIRPSRIDRHLEYLSRRWAEGCHNSALLHEEIRSRGYRESESLVRQFDLTQKLGRAQIKLPKPTGL